MLLLLSFAFSKTRAQEQSLYFEKLTVQNGLSHNKVNCIIQDKRGFTWLGTDDGLNRYDGKNFVHFRNRPGDTSTISGNIITDLIEDKQGLIWITTHDGGLTRYDYRLPPLQQFKQYRHRKNDPGSIPTNTINTLFEDASGFLWLGTGGRSVIRFNKKTERFDDITKNTRTVLDLCQDNSGLIWVGRQGGGIMKIDPAGLTFHEDERYRDLYAKLPHVTVTALHKDGEGNIWFGSWDKVLYKHSVYSGTEEVLSSGIAGFINDEILCFAEDARGRIWMGGKGKGLQVYDKSTNRFTSYAHDAFKEGSVADDRINCIYIDQHQKVWIGTNSGISINNPQKQQFTQQFLRSKNNADLVVYDFYEDEYKSIWIGSSDGIFILKPDGTVSQKNLVFGGQNLHVTSFFKDVDGTFYLGTNYSLFVYDVNANKISLLPNTAKDGVMNRIIESRVVSIVKHKINNQPALMVLPYGHFLAYYDLNGKRWVSRLDSSDIVRRFNLKDNLLRKFYKTKDGNLFLATAKEGLVQWNDGARYFVHDPSDPNSISNNSLTDIIEDSKNNLWLASFGGGLIYFDRKLQHFTRIPASPNLIEGLQLDARENVWMISNGNLYKYDPVNKTHTSYALPDLEKSGGVKGKIGKDSRGRLYMGGKNYFISFHPDSLKEMRTQPRAWLTDFLVFNRSFSHWLQQKEIKINYKDNYFAFEFAAPGHDPGQAIYYSYILEGFHTDWVDAGERNYVSFSNLDGGEYTFKVRASHSPGIWNNHFTSKKIVVIPPLWKRPVFYIGCFLFLMLAGYGIYRYRINELLKRQAIRNKIAQDLHDNVGSTLSSISVYSQVARIYQEQEKNEDLRNAIEKIGSASSEMISELNDTVWVIKPGNDNMQVLLDRMESFARPLLLSKQIQFRMDYDPALLPLSLEMEKRKNFYLVFKEVVINALKYSRSKNLSVNLRQEGNVIYMVIEDDGEGFDLTADAGDGRTQKSFGGGNGLMNMRRRAGEMKGTLVIDSAPDKGTRVELSFPIHR